MSELANDRHVAGVRYLYRVCVYVESNVMSRRDISRPDVTHEVISRSVLPILLAFKDQHRFMNNVQQVEVAANVDRVEVHLVQFHSFVVLNCFSCETFQ
jgi:hypothetical protein